MNATVSFFFACWLNSLPGPITIKYEESILQSHPIDLSKCPDDDNLQKYIGFELYTRYNPTEAVQLRVGDDDALIRSRIDFNLPTMMFFHAFFEDYIAVTAQVFKQGYLQLGGYNLLFVNAPRLLAGPWYLTAVHNTAVVGKYAAYFIDYLVSRGLRLNSLHLVGLSLGGQTAGVCGHFIQSGSPARITALDPAGPLFSKLPASLRLDNSDAVFVDVIHTDAGVLGFGSSIGHVDFWPNQGISPQPGCTYADVAKRNPGALFEPIIGGLINTTVNQLRNRTHLHRLDVIHGDIFKTRTVMLTASYQWDYLHRLGEDTMGHSVYLYGILLCINRAQYRCRMLGEFYKIDEKI